jgi:putative GTP pyrophosphokinase
MLDIAQLRKTWEEDEPKFVLIAKHTIGLLKSRIALMNINVEITWRTKDLISLIKKIKRKSKEQDYNYKSIGDKLGIRVVCSFNDELEVIDTLINDLFIISKRDIKRDSFKFNSLEYTSNHYDVCLKKEEKKLKNIDNPAGFNFEIQVRTINQDAWAKMAHKLSYKNELEVSDDQKRSIYRLLALYELADEEFNRVNKMMLVQADNVPYTLIRNLEKYVYRYAYTDFDREISEYYIEIILSFIDKEHINSLPARVEEFVSGKEESIIEVYNQEDIKQNEHYWLITQPEVFLVWFCIDNYFYVIRDNWGQYFDFEEFEFLVTIWGKSVS